MSDFFHIQTQSFRISNIASVSWFNPQNKGLTEIYFLNRSPILLDFCNSIERQVIRDLAKVLEFNQDLTLLWARKVYERALAEIEQAAQSKSC